MLLELAIQNIAIVEDLRVRFESGFSVLTGETGAGKSVILGALSLVLGERAKGDLLSDGADRGSVEALFEISPAHPAAAYLHSQNIALEKREPLVLRREISKSGATRNYVNGHYVPLTVLNSLGDLLVDFHGQHDHQSLFRLEEQLNLLDHYAGALPLRAEVQALFNERQKVATQFEDLRRLEAERHDKMELLQFQIQEIAQAKLKEGEEEELEQERNRLAHAEKLRQLLQEACALLADDEKSAEPLMSGATRHLQEAAKLDPSLEKESEKLKSIQIELREAAGSLRDVLEEIEADPARLEEIEQRLSLLWKLKKKYGGSLAQVLQFLSEQQEKMKQLESLDEKLKELNKNIEQIEIQLKEKGCSLTRQRQKAAAALSKKAEEELRGLGMPRCRFEVGFQEQSLGPFGAEAVEFLIAPNVGESAKPLRSIASGGEISRVMLALKAVFAAASSVSTMIFDEIDVNIGASVASQVGKKMAGLARSKQILCITHLPQVASHSDHHFRVHKEVARGRTRTFISALTPPEKTEELARMLSGEKITTVAREHAKELLQGKQK